MTKAPVDLQDLRRKLYVKAKAEPSWRFWGLYVHVCKEETLHAAYQLAKKNNGAPGIDGVSFDDIEASPGGVGALLQQLRDELDTEGYRPMRLRKVEISKGEGRGTRTLSIPTIRDRVVQGALKMILEPIFEADFQPGSFGYRPKRSAHGAIRRVAAAIACRKTRVIDLDLRGFFDNVRHHLVLAKIANRVSDPRILRLLKLIVKSTGKRGVPQGGVISPLISNIYLNEVDKMLEKAKEVTAKGRYTYVEYVRFADDIVVLVDGFARHAWLLKAIWKRLGQEFARLEVGINETKTRIVDLTRGDSFRFLGFEFRQVESHRGRLRPHYAPCKANRKKLLEKLKNVFRRFRSRPTDQLIALVNPILRGWTGYFRIGHSSRCFGYVRDWVEKKIRRHLMRSRGWSGFGWNKWSRRWLYETLGLFSGYRLDLSYESKASPA